MTKEERQIRDENIVKDILAGMSNKELFEKYGLKETAIRKIAKNASITRKLNPQIQASIDDDTKSEGGVHFSNDEPTVEDLQDQNDNLKDELAECQEHIAALEATVKELKADTAHIGHATIDVLDNKQSKQFILHIQAMGDDPERDEVCDYEKALNLIMDVDHMDEDTAKFILDHYDNAKKRPIRRITIMPNHGQQFRNLNNDVSNWNEAYQKLNERITDLENKL